MVNKIERQAIQPAKQQVQEVKYQQTQPQQAAVSNIQDLQEPRADRVARALTEFGETSTKVAAHIAMKQIEKDKIEQTSRALKGLTSTSKSKAGERAHRLVKNDRLFNQEYNSYLQWREANPDASPEEVESRKSQFHNNVLQDVQDDKTLLKNASLRLQEVQSALTQVDFTVEEAHRKFEGADDFKYNIMKVSKLTPEELSKQLEEGGDLYEIARGLDFKPEEVRQLVIEAAQEEALNGNDNIIKATKKLGWGLTSKEIIQAEKTYQNVKKTKDALFIGKALSVLDAQASGGLVPEDELEGEIQKLRDKHPEALSDVQIANLFNKLKKANTERDTATAAVVAYLEGERGGIPYGLNPKYTESEKVRMGEIARQMLTTAINASIANGELEVPEGVEHDVFVADYVIKNLASFSKDMVLEIPEVRRVLDRVAYYEPDPEASEPPAWLSTFLEVDEKLGAIGSVLYGSKDAEIFAMNYRALLDYDVPPLEAFNNAHAGIYGKDRISATDKNNIREEVRKEAKARFTVGRIERWFDFTNTKFKQNQQQLDDIAAEVVSVAEHFIGAGAANTNAILDRAFEIVKATTVQISNGQHIKGTPASIAISMGLGREEDDGEGNISIVVSEIETEAIPHVFEAYFEDKKDIMQGNSAFDKLNWKDVEVTTTPEGLVSFKDTAGKNLLGVEFIHLSQLKPSYLRLKRKEVDAIMRRGAAEQKKEEYREAAYNLGAF